MKRGSQEGVRLHTIHRSSGQTRVWEIPQAFFTVCEVNAFDTEGE